MPPIRAGQIVGVLILGAFLLGVLTDRDAPTDASSTATGDSAAAGREATALAGSGDAEGTPYEVTASSLRLRAGPSAAAAVRGGAGRGELAYVLGRQGAWLDVRLRDGTRGWMHGDYLAPLAGGETGRRVAAPNEGTGGSSVGTGGS